MRRLVFAAALFFALTGPAQAELGIDFGKYHAVVIGNAEYQHLRDLRTSAADASAVAKMLERRYGFEVELLANATRYDIVSALARKRAELTEGDNLLVYYAGHSALDVASDQGYWLPVDAEPDNPVNWITNSTITAQLRAMRAKHVLVAHPVPWTQVCLTRRV